MPNLSQSQVSDLVKKLYQLTVTDVHSLPSYEDRNFYVAASDGGEYILKIMNFEWTKKSPLIEVQTHSMTFLHQSGLPTQNVLTNVNGEKMSVEQLDCGFGSKEYIVRLLTYLPGFTISKVSPSPQLLFQVGLTVAKLDATLQKMDHPHLCAWSNEKFRWSLDNMPILDSFLKFLDKDPALEAVKFVIQQFKTTVAPKYRNFRKCINHGDLNQFNILVKPDEENGFRVSGIIDFGDMHSGYFVHELAIAIAHLSSVMENPVEAGGPILAGFTSVFPLNEAEKSSLYILVLSRCCQVVVFTCPDVLHVKNTEYIRGLRRNALSVLCKLWEQGKENVEKVWLESAAQLLPMDA